MWPILSILLSLSMLLQCRKQPFPMVSHPPLESLLWLLGCYLLSLLSLLGCYLLPQGCYLLPQLPSVLFHGFWAHYCVEPLLSECLVKVDPSRTEL